MRTIQVFQEFCGNNTLRTSTAVKLKSLRGSYFLGYVPIFSPVKVDKEREGKRQAERSRRRERGDQIGLAALAGGYSPRCHGNCWEEEMEEDEGEEELIPRE